MPCAPSQPGEVLLVRNPHAVRPWQHVLEPLSGYIALAEKLLNGEEETADAFNFGPAPENAQSVQEVINAVTTLWGGGGGGQWKHDDGIHPPETRFLSLDSTKAMKALNWRPMLNLTTTLKMTIEWYKAHRMGANMNQVSREHVYAYKKTQEQNT